MVKKGDFLRIEYTGYDESGKVFDSTSGEIAKDLHGREGSMLLVFGVDYVVQGMQDALAEMKKGEEREFSVEPERGFGHRDQSRLKIFPLNDFYSKEIDPQPGAVIQLETDVGAINGTVKSVNSGRVLMDFNHPLANQNVKYKLKLCDVVESAEGKLGELVKDLEIAGSFSLAEGKATILLKKGQPELDLRKTRLSIAVRSTIPEIKDIEFKEE